MIDEGIPLFGGTDRRLLARTKGEDVSPHRSGWSLRKPPAWRTIKSEPKPVQIEKTGCPPPGSPGLPWVCPLRGTGFVFRSSLWGK